MLEASYQRLLQLYQEEQRQHAATRADLKQLQSRQAHRPKPRGKMDGKAWSDSGKHTMGNISGGGVVLVFYAIMEESIWPLGSRAFWNNPEVNTALVCGMNGLIAVLYKALRKFD